MMLSRCPFPKSLLVALIGAGCAPAFAQAAGEPSNDEPVGTSRIVIQGATIGLRQTRANVKITAADLDYYPPGVSADKVLERISGIQVGSSNAFGGDGFESTISMRGFGKDSIGFSIDGIPNGRTTLGGGSVPTRYFDSSNLAGVDVSQSAGVIGAPSHQALVGHVNYLTADPDKRFTLRGEAAAGSAAFGRLFARIDSGEIAPGITSYLSVSSQQSKVSYVDDPTGKNTRDHLDLKVVARLEGGGVVKLRTGYNDRKETSGTNIVTLASFRANPKVDGLTDTWTGTPSIDRNNRAFASGNPRTDQLTSAELSLPIAGGLKFDAKAYYHTQDGVGKGAALGTTGTIVLDGKSTSLYFRANDYSMNRRGALAEVSGKRNDLIDWRVGGWAERYDRAQVRTWHKVFDPSVGPAYDANPAATSEDKHWTNSIQMLYLANRSGFLDGRLKFDYGVSVIHNQVDYNAPIQDFKPAKLNYVNEARVKSGALPKVGAVWALAPATELFGGFARNAASVTDATLEGGAAATRAAALKINAMDTADAFDLGVRHKGDSYALGVQAFSVKSKETVAADIGETLQSENVEQGRRIHGVEFTYSVRLGDWRLYSALTLQKHGYALNNTDANGNPAKGFVRNGADLIGIADRNLFLEATWRPTDAIKLAVNARAMSSRAGYYANPRVANSGVDERLPGYGLVGLNGSYNFGAFTTGLNVENLFNKSYISGIAPELVTNPSTIGRYFIGSPRSVVLWVKAEI